MGEPTEDDLLSWGHDQLFKLGQIGFSTEWRPQEIADLTVIHSKSPPIGTEHILGVQEPGILGIDFVSTTSCLQEYVRDYTRDQEIQKAIAENRSLLDKPCMRLRESLLKAGMNDATLDHHVGNGVGFYELIELLDQQLISPKEARKTAPVYIVEDKGNKSMTRAALPIDGSIVEAYSILEDLTMAHENNDDVVNDKGFWMYQFVDKHNQAFPGTTRTRLSSDADYRSLMKRIEGTKDPAVCLFREAAVDESHRKFAAKLGNMDLNDDVLDEDGVPYFQPVDLGMLIARTEGRIKVRKEPSAPRRSARIKARIAK